MAQRARTRLHTPGGFLPFAVAIACGSRIGCSPQESPPAAPAPGTGTATATATATADPTAASADAGSDAVSPPPVACLPQSFLDSMARTFSCESKGKLEGPVADLPFDCHSQGIGWSPPAGRIVTSCMDLDGPSGRLLTFPPGGGSSGQWPSDGALALVVDAGMRHPSAFQIGPTGVFAVAMAPASNTGPSEIRFYRTGSPALSGPVGSFRYELGHIGAVTYASTLREGVSTTVVIGCGWDCATLGVWRAPGSEATDGFSLVHDGPTAGLVDPGVDENVGKYNSLFFAERCEDRAPLLVASHDDWIDVWLVHGLLSPAIRLEKIVKRRITESVVLHGTRPIFHEGMTLEIAGSNVTVWAEPHDFGTDSCPAGTRCAQDVYRGRFGP